LTRVKTTGVAFALLLVAVPAAAIDVPQSRQEFVKAVTKGARGASMETFTAGRDFETIYRLVEKKAAACLDVEVKRSANVGYWERSSSDYNPTVRRAGNGKGEFALQVIHRPRAIGEKTSAGGLYIMAADMQSLGGGRTKIVFYQPTIGHKKITKSVKSWLSGEDAPCPKMK
jgi:hypothetical protein